MSKSTDERGRIYLPKDVRERFGTRYRIVELPNHVALFPVDEDPLEGLRAAVGDAFEGEDAGALKAEAREAISRAVQDEAESWTQGREELVVYVETDFLMALVKDEDRLREPALRTLEEREDVHTSILAYAEVLVLFYNREAAAYEIDALLAIANLLELVPIVPDAHEEAVLAAAAFLEEYHLTPFDALHAGVVATGDQTVLSSEDDYDTVGIERTPLEPDSAGQPSSDDSP